MLEIFWYILDGLLVPFRELSRAKLSRGTQIIWLWFELMFSSIRLFQKAGICWHFILSRHEEKKKWPINGATAEVQMWAGVVMAALLPQPAGGCRRKNCDRRLQGTRPLMRADRVSLQSTVLSADCCHILWHSANQKCLWKITDMCKEHDSRCAILAWFGWLPLHWMSEDAGAVMINSIFAFILTDAFLGGGGFHVESSLHLSKFHLKSNKDFATLKEQSFTHLWLLINKKVCF